MVARVLKQYVIYIILIIYITLHYYGILQLALYMYTTSASCSGQQQDGVHDAAIIATCIRAHNSNSFLALPLMCALTSCKLQRLLHCETIQNLISENNIGAPVLIIKCVHWLQQSCTNQWGNLWLHIVDNYSQRPYRHIDPTIENQLFGACIYFMRLLVCLLCMCHCCMYGWHYCLKHGSSLYILLPS